MKTPTAYDNMKFIKLFLGISVALPSDANDNNISDEMLAVKKLQFIKAALNAISKSKKLTERMENFSIEQRLSFFENMQKLIESIAPNDQVFSNAKLNIEVNDLRQLFTVEIERCHRAMADKA